MITMLDGARFEYSHEFVNLLVSQLDATLEGLPVDARIRRNKGRSGETVLWPDSSVDDYIHRPNHKDTTDLCSHVSFSRFQKQCKTFKEMNSNQQKGNGVLSNDDIGESNKKQEGILDNNEVEQVQKEPAKFKFTETHPRHDVSHLHRRKFEVIPVSNIQKRSLCSIKELNLNSDALQNENHMQKQPC